MNFPDPLRGDDVWIPLASDGEIFEVRCVIEHVVDEVDTPGPMGIGIVPPLEAS